MAKITFENKVALNVNSDIADVNKCNATDLNEIKNVVNENDDNTTTNTNNIADNAANIGTLSNLNTTNKNDLVSAINELVVESGSNEIGEYVKYANGRLITMHKVTRNLARTSAWGNMYESTAQADLGNYPIAFKDTPFVYITLHEVNAMLEAVQFSTTSNAGKVYILAPTLSEGADYVFQVLAIGRWK